MTVCIQSRGWDAFRVAWKTHEKDIITRGTEKKMKANQAWKCLCATLLCAEAHTGMGWASLLGKSHSSRAVLVGDTPLGAAANCRAKVHQKQETWTLPVDVQHLVPSGREVLLREIGLLQDPRPPLAFARPWNQCSRISRRRWHDSANVDCDFILRWTALMMWSVASWNSDSETRLGAKMPSSYALALTKKKKKQWKRATITTAGAKSNRTHCMHTYMYNHECSIDITTSFVIILLNSMQNERRNVMPVCFFPYFWRVVLVVSFFPLLCPLCLNCGFPLSCLRSL